MWRRGQYIAESLPRSALGEPARVGISRTWKAQGFDAKVLRRFTCRYSLPEVTSCQHLKIRRLLFRSVSETPHITPTRAAAALRIRASAKDLPSREKVALVRESLAICESLVSR